MRPAHEEAIPPAEHATQDSLCGEAITSGVQAAGDPLIEFEPGLVEEAVLRAADRLDPRGRKRFRAERDPLYRLASPEDREEAFRFLHSRWFLALRLGEGVEALVAEQPILAGATARRAVLRAGSAKEEGVDLHAPGDGRGGRLPSLVIRLLPGTLLDRPRLERLLRPELLHAADMQDPSFGYEPALTLPEEDPVRRGIVLDRYRVLWETTVAGRLDRNGLLPCGAGSSRRAIFAAAFPMIGPALEAHFQRFYAGPRPSHADLLAFASGPPAGGGAPHAGRDGS